MSFEHPPLVKALASSAGVSCVAAATLSPVGLHRAVAIFSTCAARSAVGVITTSGGVPS